MLYHWHELDPNAARPRHCQPDGRRLHDTAIKYDARTAAQRARGKFIQSSLTDLGLIAVNDERPDDQALSLREAGLGRICQFNGSSSHVSVADKIQQINKRCLYALCVAYCSMLSAIYFVRQWWEGNEPRCSHKMVANHTVHSTDASYGAHRQRFQRSVRKLTK